MKVLTNFLQKTIATAKNHGVSKEFLTYTGIFLGLMVGLYLYMVFAGMAKAPNFTYSEF
ncbi:MAG: hypothetical protein SPI74_01300 [Eubacterium sp.]|nr:hypothetical protein [Eubacterium sp.]